MIVYVICYAVSVVCARFGWNIPAGLALIMAAAYLYYYDYRRTGNVLHLRAVFSASWVGGQGVACLKLSKLQTDWAATTWICFFFALTGFWITFEVLDRLFGEGEDFRGLRKRRRGGNTRSLFHCIIAVTVVSLTAFILEAVVLGYIPLFLKGVPHAYSEFHLTGVHYFTVSCVLTPSLAVLYFLQGGSRDSRKNTAVVVMTGISLLIPILCVSRFQFIFAVTVALFTYLASRRRASLLLLAGLAAVMIPVYLVLTVARSHDVAYLNSIFEMKNSNMPIFISQPYIYIANNYENFNCLVEALPAHTYGVRMLFPLWALTGLKFMFPYLISFPIYVDKAELTTLTMFYDAFYDFGMVGVLLFSCLLGAAAFWLVNKLAEMRNPMGYLLYGQIAFYLALSFFTTWFSNTTTWFNLILTGLMAFYLAWRGH